MRFGLVGRSFIFRLNIFAVPHNQHIIIWVWFIDLNGKRKWSLWYRSSLMTKSGTDNITFPIHKGKQYESWYGIWKFLFFFFRSNTFGLAVASVTSKVAIVPIYSQPMSTDGSGQLNYRNWLRPPTANRTIGRQMVALDCHSPITVNFNKVVPMKIV